MARTPFARNTTVSTPSTVDAASATLLGRRSGPGAVPPATGLAGPVAGWDPPPPPLPAADAGWAWCRPGLVPSARTWLAPGGPGLTLESSTWSCAAGRAPPTGALGAAWAAPCVSLRRSSATLEPGASRQCPRSVVRFRAPLPGALPGPTAGCASGPHCRVRFRAHCRVRFRAGAAACASPAGADSAGAASCDSPLQRAAIRYPGQARCA